MGNTDDVGKIEGSELEFDDLRSEKLEFDREDVGDTSERRWEVSTSFALPNGFKGTNFRAEEVLGTTSDEEGFFSDANGDDELVGEELDEHFPDFFLDNCVNNSNKKPIAIMIMMS